MTCGSDQSALAHPSDAPPRPGRRGGGADRQRDRHHEPIRSGQRRCRRKHPCQYIVVLFDVFEHVTNVELAAAEVARVLRPGGAFHCFVPCEGNRRTIFSLLRKSRLLPIHRWKRDHIGHIQVLTTRQMKSILDSHGLRVTRVSFSFHLLGQIHDVADYWRREMLSRKSLPPWQRALVKAVSRAIFIPTWRLAYYEDTFRQRDPAAIGVHITCRRR